MSYTKHLRIWVTAMLLLAPLYTLHADEAVYGWEIMTAQERLQHREQLRNMKTEAEREAYRLEHHKRMQERAQEQGITLHEVPMERGTGMRQRDGMDPGMGPGMGSGSGMGGRR